MIRKILFAADLGVFTPHSLAHVEELAIRFSAEVSVVHVVNPFGELATALVKSYPQHVENEILNPERVRQILESVREQIFELILSESSRDCNLVSRISDIVVAEGQPASVILKEVDRLGADLIVIGNHGSHAIDNNILGSVAAKILQLAKIPVFMVPMMAVDTTSDCQVSAKQSAPLTAGRMFGG